MDESKYNIILPDDPIYEDLTPEESEKYRTMISNELNKVNNFLKDNSTIYAEEIIINNDMNKDNLLRLSDKISSKVNKDIIVDSNSSPLKKPGTFEKGNKEHLKRKRKDKRTISSLIDKHLSNKKNAQEFVDRLFHIFMTEKNPMAAGIEILNRHEGKVKDVISVTHLGEHVPDQAEQLEMQNKFKKLKAV